MKTLNRVFVLDKDPISAMILKSKLVENETLDISAFQSITECITSMHYNPSVIVIHHQVQDQQVTDGVDLINQMRSQSPATRFILISDHYDRKLMFNYINDNDVTYLARDTSKFATRVKAMVEDILPPAVHRKVA